VASRASEPNLAKTPFHGNFEVGSTTYLDWPIVGMNADWFGKPTIEAK
jgi:hypothetical protein